MNKIQKMEFDSVLKTIDVNDIDDAVIIYQSRKMGECIVRSFTNSALQSAGLIVYGLYLWLANMNRGRNV